MSSKLPSVGYGVKAYLQKDIDLLEKVQRRATRMMANDKSLSLHSEIIIHFCVPKEKRIAFLSSLQCYMFSTIDTLGYETVLQDCY